MKMKTYRIDIVFFIFAISLFFDSSTFIYSQEDYKCVINRDGHHMVLLLGCDGDTTALLSHDTLTLRNNERFRFVHGKGRKKDSLRERECHKRYLIDINQKDTLATIRTRKKEIQLGKNLFQFTRERNCWKIFSDHDTLVWCRYSWDKQFFRYSIQTDHSRESLSESLLKAFTPYLKELYLKEMSRNDTDSDNGSIWLILFSTFLVN